MNNSMLPATASLQHTRRPFLLNHFCTLACLAVFSLSNQVGPSNAAMAAQGDQPQPLIQAGDRVVFVGSGWVERMQHHPWLETMLTLQVPGATFRNIGWSGDTVFGDARAVFGARADGYQRLMRDLDMAAPKVIMLCYGENEAFGNDAERAEFIAGYHKLLDDVKRHNAKVILVIPRQREDAGKEFPNPKYYNQNLSKLAEAIRKLAKDHNCSVVDLEKFAPNERFTKEGVAWNDEGYQKSAREIMKQLGFANPRADKIVASKPQQIETIQAAIQKKNEWFFHRYRPQNETYLFLFRKHEQGNNAVEVDRMEQFVADGESQITKWLADNQLAPAQ